MLLLGVNRIDVGKDPSSRDLLSCLLPNHRSCNYSSCLAACLSVCDSYFILTNRLTYTNHSCRGLRWHLRSMFTNELITFIFSFSWGCWLVNDNVKALLLTSIYSLCSKASMSFGFAAPMSAACAMVHPRVFGRVGVRALSLSLVYLSR